MDFKGPKPIVRFNHSTTHRIQPYIQLEESAYVHALDHPRLGKQDVCTSTVLSIFYNCDGVLAFETHNTIYVLDTYKIPE